jgi:hypothetical protein
VRGSSVATPGVAALAEGVLKAMFIAQLKVWAALVLAVGLAVGGVTAWQYAAAARGEAAHADRAPSAQEPKKPDAEQTARCQVRFVGPAAAKLRRFGDDDKAAQEVPCRLTFEKPGTYRLKLTNIPNRPGLELYPSITLYPATAKTSAYLAHSAIVLEFTAEDFELAAAGKVATRMVCLPDDADETVKSPRADDEAIAAALKNGTLLLVARLGSIDLEAKKPAEDDAYRAALIAALHLFAEKGELDHLKAVLAKHPDLLDAKQIFRQPHKPSRGDDFTPLIVAVQEGRDEVAAYLLSKGANVQADDWLQGWTPLHIAARRGDLNMAKLLLKHGAKLTAKDARGRTPLDLAAEEKRPEVVELLNGLEK